jgi:hypothetical protein
MMKTGGSRSAVKKFCESLPISSTKIDKKAINFRPTPEPEKEESTIQ